MGKKRSLKGKKPKWPPPREIQEQVNRTVAEFCRENPHIDTLEKFDVVMEKIMAVATLPPALYLKYRYSGKSFEEVYEEIMTNNKN